MVKRIPAAPAPCTAAVTGDDIAPIDIKIDIIDIRMLFHISSMLHWKP